MKNEIFDKMRVQFEKMIEDAIRASLTGDMKPNMMKGLNDIVNNADDSKDDVSVLRELAFTQISEIMIGNPRLLAGNTHALISNVVGALIVAYQLGKFVNSGKVEQS